MSPSNTVAAAAVAVVFAAVFTPPILWPDTGELDDPDPALKAYALLAGASLLVPATICWAGSVITTRLDTLVATSNRAARSGKDEA